MFNFSYRRVGGLRFLKLGRLTVSFSISRHTRPIAAPPARRVCLGPLPAGFVRTRRGYVIRNPFMESGAC